MKKLNKYSGPAAGFLYVEIIIVLVIFLIFIHLAGFCVYESNQKRQLYVEAQHLALLLRQLQQEQMQSSPHKDNTERYLSIRRDHYYFFQNMKAQSPYYFPKGIVNVRGFPVIAFHRNGLPERDKQITLGTEHDKYRATIYIAVQTGRIRVEMWETKKYQ